jgi:hypothetical protein
MTFDDFLPTDPPAGLENTITANWLASNVIEARHIQVNGSRSAGDGTRRSFKINPLANRPLHYAKLDSTGKVTEDIFYIEQDGDAYFSGKLSKDTVDINSI